MIPVWLSAIALSNADPQFIYFILVDRYFNGDPSNDIRIDLEDPQAFHGGDLQGITQKLDSIQTLGADTIWLSPIFE
ncbi:MAG: alpha-amylase family glycosyl hydrolase, partial [Myxococcota bacterium]|nr:alpha-amylase family glycosyl hydrolase [Myxococcota bacterium]